MLRIIFFSTFIILLSQCFSCKFDLFEDYTYIYPEITIENIEQLQDTTFIDINVIDNGEPIELIGITYEIDEAPSLANDQLLFEGSSGLLRISIADLAAESNYYFLAFVGNAYAFGESQVMSFHVPLREALEVPCLLDENIIQFNGAKYNVSNVRFREDGEYVITANASQLDMSFFFKSQPTTDLYITSTDSEWDLDNTEVRVEMTLGQWRIIKKGGELYVDKKGENLYDISFCELEVQFFNSIFPVRGNVELN